jgi:hypothetical protein
MKIIHISDISYDNECLYCASHETYDALMKRLEELSPSYRWNEGQKPTQFKSSYMPVVIEIDSRLWISATGTLSDYHKRRGVERVVL